MHSSLHSSLCSAWLCSSFLLFHFTTAIRLLHVFLPFHGYAWCMPLTHAATYLGYVGTHWLDLIHICTYIPGSIKSHKCQPENSSLHSSLGYLPLQLVRTSPELIASTVFLQLRFPRAPVDAEAYLGCFTQKMFMCQWNEQGGARMMAWWRCAPTYPYQKRSIDKGPGGQGNRLSRGQGMA